MGSYHPFLKAIPYTIILFALTHLMLSFFYSVIHGDADAMNMFHVLGFNLFWPELGTGGLNTLLGALLVIATGVLVALILRWRDIRADSLREELKTNAKKSKEK